MVGSFCWNELMTRDAVAARAFYGALFGWQMVDMPMPARKKSAKRVAKKAAKPGTRRR